MLSPYETSLAEKSLQYDVTDRLDSTVPEKMPLSYETQDLYVSYEKYMKALEQEQNTVASSAPTSYTPTQDNENKEKTLTTVERIAGAPFDDRDYADLEKCKKAVQSWITLNKNKADYLNMLGEPKYAHNANFIIAGGFLVSTILDEEPKDMDIFILNATVESGPNAAGWKMVEPTYFEPAATRSIYKVMEWQGDEQYVMGNPQVITTKYTSRKQCVDDFDFEHCMISYEILTGKIYTSKNTLRAIRNKQLIQRGGRVTRLPRRQKFLNRGWTEPLMAS